MLDAKDLQRQIDDWMHPASQAPSRSAQEHFPSRSTRRPTRCTSGRTKVWRSSTGSTCDGSDMSGCAKQPATIPLSNEPAGIAVDDAHHTLYVSGESGTVAVINTSSCNGDRHARDARPRPRWCAWVPTPGEQTLDAATSTLYVANADSEHGVDGGHESRCNASTTSGCTKPCHDPCRSGAARGASPSATRSGTAYVVNVLGNNVSLLSTQSCNATDARLSECESRRHFRSGCSRGGASWRRGASAGSAGSAGAASGRTTTNSDLARRPPTTDPATSGGTAAHVPTTGPVAATGTVAGMSWSLRAASGQSGANAIEDGALVLDGQAYGLCPGFPNPAELQLIDAGADGRRRRRHRLSGKGDGAA